MVLNEVFLDGCCLVLQRFCFVLISFEKLHGNKEPFVAVRSRLLPCFCREFGVSVVNFLGSFQILFVAWLCHTISRP